MFWFTFVLRLVKFLYLILAKFLYLILAKFFGIHPDNQHRQSHLPARVHKVDVQVTYSHALLGLVRQYMHRVFMHI